MTTNSHYHSFIKDNIIIIIGQTLVYMKGIILMPLIIKTVGVSIYGGYILFSSIFGIFFGISSFGVVYRARRFLPSTTGRIARRELFYKQFFFQLFSILFLSLMLVLLSKKMNLYIFKSKFSYSVFIIPLYLFCYFLYAQGSDYLRYTSRIKYMTVVSLSFPYIDIGFILLFLYYYKYMNVNVLILAQAFSALLVAIPCFWIIFKEIGFGFSFYNIKGLISDIKVGFPTVLNFITDFILATSDRYFIAFYLTVLAVGNYNPGYVLGSLIIFIPKAIGTALPQLISRAVDNGGDHEAQKMINYALKLFLLLAIPFIFGSMLFARQILTFLTNKEVAENAYIVTPIVAMGTLFYGLGMILSTVLFVRLKTYAMFKMNFLAAIFNMSANLILLYFFRSIMVPAITTLLGYFIAFIYVYKIVIKDWSIDFQPAAIIKSVLASLVMGGILFFISLRSGKPDTMIIFSGKMVLSIIIYISGLFILRTFSKKELQFVKSYIYR